MAVRNAKPLTINSWRGLNTFISRNNADEHVWIDSNNVLVNARGEAEVLRSPKAFGNNLIFESGDSLESSPFSSEAQPILSMDEFKRVAGNALIIDRGEETVYLLAAGGEPGLIKVGNALEPWTSVSINDTMQRINSEEFIQIMNDLTSVYRNGIDPPLGPPVIAYAANASDSTVIAESLQGSYAYMNSVTGHVGQPSPLSNVLGPKAAGFDIAFTVQESPQPGVDKIVFFLTVDGGTIPYLVIDIATADPHTVANANATYAIVQSDVSRDTLTPEPIYNSVPLLNATSMFSYRDRLFLVVDGGLQYSGFETCYIGNPYESWPVLNQLNLKDDYAVGGISTQSGALVFGKEDCHLLTGFPSDKVSSPANTAAVTEHLDRLNWNVGITYPKTAVNTPFGVIWTDQTKRIRLWNQQGFPSEIAQALRTELDAMTGALSARWFQHGKNGGYYVLTNGVNTLFLMVYLAPDSGQMQFGYGKSTSLTPAAMATATFEGIERFFYAIDDQAFEILDPDVQGDGWDEDTELFFKIVIGANSPYFSSLHTMQLDGSLQDVAVTHAPMSEVDPVTVDLTDDLEADTGNVVYGLIDSDERRYHIMKFTFGIDDRFYRNVDGLIVNVKYQKRAI